MIARSSLTIKTGNFEQVSVHVYGETGRELDCEVRRIIDEQHGRVRRLLEERKPALQQRVKLLLEREGITGATLKAIMDGQVGGMVG